MSDQAPPTTTKLGVFAGATTPGGLFSPRRALYATFLLSAVGFFAAADRNIFSVLLEPIRRDLHASDTAMGALTGLSFSLVYATMALPMARLADRGIRRNVIAGALAFWSLMTTVCGFAGSYLQLLIGRMGLAAGEASGYPSQISFVGDLFPFKRRGGAIGLVVIGGSLGTAVGAVLAGFLTQRYNWHVAFLVLAFPGILLALLFFSTVPEPARGRHDGGNKPDPDSESFGRSVRYLASIPSIRPLLLAQICVNISFAGYLAWVPTYLMRVHHMHTGEMSIWYGLGNLIGGASTLASGFLSDFMAAKATRFRMIFLGIMCFIGAPLVFFLVTAKSLAIVMAMIVLYPVVVSGVASVAITAGLDIVRPRMRGFMIAAMGFCVSVIGGGGGPLLIGMINDRAKLAFGDQSLRYTLILVPAMLILAGVSYLFAGRTTDRDAAASRLAEEA